MTEAEWLECDNPEGLFDVVHAKARRFRSWPVVRWLAPDRATANRLRRLATNRRVYLLACSIDRAWWRTWYGPTEAPPRVDVQERFAEGEVTLVKLQSGAPQCRWPWGTPWDLLSEMLHRPIDGKHFVQLLGTYCELVRDIFGNPFRPVAFSPAWRTDTAIALARQMYEAREFSAMPILADALQDAGCDNDDVLSHCRGAGPHVRGCWVVDLVLGKE